MYRVIQWATGFVGQEAIKGVLAHPELELVGCWVHSPDKVGRDVGEICGIGPIGVTAVGTLEEICAIEADAVVYAPVLASTRDVIQILESGKNVVTPVGWIFPADTPGVAALEAAARTGGVTLHGTGINPGGITERFPLMLSALCRDIKHVRAEEFSDIRNYPTEVVVRDIMLFGKSPEDAAKSPMADILGHGFQQSIDMIAAELGFALDDEKRTTHEMAVATKDLDTPVGVIEQGTCAAQRFTWEGTVNGEPVITVRVNWLMGETDLDPPWTFGPEGQRFEVAFDATPPVSATFHGLHPPVVGEEPEIGLIPPAMHCVNAIPYVCAAEPGIKTYLDLPLLAGRAASTH
ncbi:MAG: dihydrodipicolinate reductase [Actinomycetota bacterium]|nr:dihydrodipicolinate reductase [Actinomycetota bacterium]